MSAAGFESRFRLVNTPFGTMAIIVRGNRLAGVLLPERNRRRLLRRLAARWPGARPNTRLMPSLAGQITAYFDGRAAEFDVPVDLSGKTGFQRRVLGQCRRIPAGRVVTYGELARRAGRPRAARAVGQTMASNPVPLIIPCHRVVASGGGLGGFSAEGGPGLKRRLLAHEKRFWGVSRPGYGHQT